jgi:hypothetical protein
MPLLRLIAEGVGPFERLDVDLSDGKGNPHLGPHIFAGVNGSGKSTVLRTLAWVMDTGKSGFRYDDWAHLTAGYTYTRALVLLRPPGAAVEVRACAKGISPEDGTGLMAWVEPILHDMGRGNLKRVPATDVRPGAIGRAIRRSELYYGPLSSPPAQENVTRFLFRDPPEAEVVASPFNVVGYSPTRDLRHLVVVDLTKGLSSAEENSLSFESTVQNEFVQSWLLSLYSKRAISRDRQQSGSQYTRALERFENALRLLYDREVSFDVEIEPSFQPRLKAFGHSLDFSQLPDGIRSTVGWIADFMMRQDRIQQEDAWLTLGLDLDGGEKRNGVLLLDEVDAHLHPLWQRKLLPAMQEALPDVQILVTSHSPFVISSCPSSCVHILELDANGRAHARPPVDSPIGESVTTTLKEIFGVDSRFDVQTERELDEWNTLKKRDLAGPLPAADRLRLKQLTVTLAERSEELRSIVASPLTIPASVLRSLTAGEKQPHPIKRRKRA